jgi:chromatin remodeling complex protein RSC6
MGLSLRAWLWCSVVVAVTSCVTTPEPVALPLSTKKAPKKPAKKAKRKANPALMKPIQPDAVLAAVIGAKPVPRGQMTKKLWDYIKKNGLQDKKVRTQINADDKLKAVFGGKKQVSMFEMTKLVSKHVS